MFANSNIQVPHAFTIIGLIVESKLKFVNDTRCHIFGNPMLEMNAVALPRIILQHYSQFTTIKNIFQ